MTCMRSLSSRTGSRSRDSTAERRADMRKKIVGFSRAALAVACGFAVCSALAQSPAKRDFDAEAQAAVQSAKTAAGSEFLGTLVRVCLLPRSACDDSRDLVAAYVANPACAAARYS